MSWIAFSYSLLANNPHPLKIVSGSGLFGITETELILFFNEENSGCNGCQVWSARSTGTFSPVIFKFHKKHSKWVTTYLSSRTVGVVPSTTRCIPNSIRLGTPNQLAPHSWQTYILSKTKQGIFLFSKTKEFFVK